MLALALALASFTVPFGKAPAQVGLIREPESSPEAPGSLAVDDAGRAFVLDAVDERVAVFSPDGKLDASIPLPSDTIEDFALLPSGDIAVLDRLVDRTVSVIAPNGAVLARAAVEGAGVDDGGEVTAIFADADGVWLEVLHGAQVRVLDASLKVDERRVVRPGVPMAVAGAAEQTAAEQYVRLRKVGDVAQVLFFDKAGAVVADGAVSFQNLLELSGLVVKGDRIWVAGHELDEAIDAAGARTIKSDRVVVVELRRKGDRLREIGRHVTKASPEWVPLKQLVAAPDGVAHLYVNSMAKPGQPGMEVTSW